MLNSSSLCIFDSLIYIEALLKEWEDVTYKGRSVSLNILGVVVVCCPDDAAMSLNDCVLTEQEKGCIILLNSADLLALLGDCLGAVCMDVGIFKGFPCDEPYDTP